MVAATRTAQSVSARQQDADNFSGSCLVVLAVGCLASHVILLGQDLSRCLVRLPRIQLAGEGGSATDTGFAAARRGQNRARGDPRLAIARLSVPARGATRRTEAWHRHGWLRDQGLGCRVQGGVLPVPVAQYDEQL